GDSAIFHLDMDTMTAKTGQPKPEFIDKYAIFNVRVNKHFKKGDLTDSALYAEINTYFDGEIAKLKDLEQGKIDNYVSSNKLSPEKTSSGLQVVFDEKGA